MNSIPTEPAPRSFFSRFSLVCNAPQTPEQRAAVARSRRRSAAALIVFIACSQLAQFLHPGLYRSAAGFIAGLAFCGVIFASGQLVWHTSDEFRRHLLTQSFLCATLLTFTLATLWGYLEVFSGASLPRIPLLVLPVALIIFTAAAKVVIFRQHRSPRD